MSVPGGAEIEGHVSHYLALVLVVGIAAGCTAGPALDGARETGGVAYYEGVACAPRVERLRAYLRTVDAAGRDVSSNQDELPLVAGAKGTTARMLPLVTIAADGTPILDGRTESLAQVLRDLDTLERNWAILRPGVPNPRRVSANFAADTPAAGAANLLAAIARTGRGAEILVRTGARRSTLPPAPPSVRAQLGADPAVNNPGLVKALVAAIGGCSPMTRLFGSVANASGENKAPILLGGAADAVAECHCSGVDIDGLEYLLTVVSGVGGPVVHAFAWDGRMPEPGETRAEQWIARIAPR